MNSYKGNTLSVCHFELSENSLELLRDFSSLCSSKGQESISYETIMYRMIKKQSAQ